MISNKQKIVSICNIKTDSNAILLVNLKNLENNYKYLKKKAPNSEIGVSLKANAYGLGYKKICRTLIKLGCKTFFVASPKEGLEVIKINSNINVYVLNGITTSNEAELLVQNGVKIVINNNFQLDVIIRLAKEKRLKPNCAIHFDTGINRLGLEINQLSDVLIIASKYLKVSMIMSHLSNSEIKESSLNNLQLRRFKLIKKNFKNSKNIKYSLANSNGIFLDKKYHFNICRPGGLIYGLNLSEVKINNIKSVVIFLGRIIQIKAIKKGEYVGYGAKFKAKKKLIIATVGLGYADGLPRSFSGEFHYKNYKFPVIGNISMDLCTINVSNCKELKVNHWVEIFGNRNSIEEFANTCDTITYEISSKLGSRVKKIYINNDIGVN